MKQKKTFYDYKLSSQKARQKRNRRFPELAMFHIALREELNEQEYQDFFNAEKESISQLIALQEKSTTWAEA